jgi:two-component sensor histidine kinase
VWRGTSQDVTARVVAEEAVRQSLQEKETLLREIHHRVKNNLQIIASLLHFQSKRVRDPADVAAFTDGRNRLRAMILVHEKLYQSKDLSNIEFGSYLRSLVNDLHQSYSAEGRRLQMDVAADQVALPVQIAAPCGMIVCELLTNAFKYAFPGGEVGRVAVSLSAADGKLRLCVQDNGVGLPATFDPQRASSFGWQLIRNLAAQISGTIQIDRSSGTRVIIDFRNEAAG